MFNLLERIGGGGLKPGVRRKEHRRRLKGMEVLDDRRMLATFMVMNGGDGTVDANTSQPGTLRQAIYDAQQTNDGPDIITFSPSVTEIDLTAGALLIGDSLTIIGNGWDQLTIDGQGTPSAVFTIGRNAGDDFDVSISDLAVTRGHRGIEATLGSQGDGRSLTLDRLHVHGNIGNSGGGIRVVADATDNVVTMNDLIVENNEVTGVNDGGGIYLQISGRAEMDNLLVRGNVLPGGQNSGANQYNDGGGMYITGDGDANVLLQNSYIVGNSAGDGSAPFGSSGGGIFVVGSEDFDNIGGKYTFERIVVADNIAAGEGGGIYSAGIYQLSSTDGLEVTNSLVTGNRAAQGGGVSLPVGYATISHSTIADNTAGWQTGGGGGGGVLSVTFNATTYVTLNHTIVARNKVVLSDFTTDPDSHWGPDLGLVDGGGFNSGGVIDATYSIIGDLIGTPGPVGVGIRGLWKINDPNTPWQFSGTGNQYSTTSVLSAGLAPNLSNATSVQYLDSTMMPTLPLETGSIAIDAGNATLTPSSPPQYTFDGATYDIDHDQRGAPYARVVDTIVTSPENPQIDIGAYEFQTVTPPPAPRVTDVVLRTSSDELSMADSRDGGDQLITIGFDGVDEIAIEFDEPIDDLPALDTALRLVPLPGGGAINASAATVSTDGLTVTWDLPSGVQDGLFVIDLVSDDVVGQNGENLDGEWINARTVDPSTAGSNVSDFTTKSGDGTAGGDFLYAFVLLKGDADHDGDVDGDDQLAVQTNFGASNLTDGAGIGDADSDDDVDGDDLIAVQQNFANSVDDLFDLYEEADMNNDGKVDGMDDTDYYLLRPDLNGDGVTSGTLGEIDDAIFELYKRIEIATV